MAAEGLRVLACLAVTAVAVSVGACGTGGRGPTPGTDRSQGRPTPIAAQSRIGLIPRATPAMYRRPLREYRRFVSGRLGAMRADITRLRRALDAGDAAAARRAWLQANVRYQSIGAAYGAFGALDAAIDTGTAGLPGGVRDPSFTGLHRVEYALWGRHSLADARAPAARLQRDVSRLQRRIATVTITPLDYSLRAHEILEDTLNLQLTGQASPWSGAVFDGVAANAAGAQEVLRTLTPMLDGRARGRRLQADQALARLATAVRRLQRADGTLPPAAAVAPGARRRIAALTAAAAEALAYVPEIIDPRPPRPARSLFPHTS